MEEQKGPNLRKLAIVYEIIELVDQLDILVVTGLNVADSKAESLLNIRECFVDVDSKHLESAFQIALKNAQDNVSDFVASVKKEAEKEKESKAKPHSTITLN